jgi:hypothetical protein
MARQYNKAQEKIINDAWFSLQRMVESSHRMEARLSGCLKEQRRHFPMTAARSHILHSVRNGLRLCHGAPLVECGEMRNRAGDDDEHVLALAIGMHYSDHPQALELIATLNNVAREETAAQQAYLATL